MAGAYKYLPAGLESRLRRLAIKVRLPVEGGLQGVHRSPHHGSSVEFADYREYTHGDSPALIDWAVYARTDHYVIRRYQEETNLRGYLLLDTSESMAFRLLGPCTKLDYAATLAASIMYLLASQGDAAGLTLFNEAVVTQIPPARTLEGLRPMLLALEEIQPRGRTGLAAALHRLAEEVRSRSLVLVISDLLQDPAEILRGLQHLRHNGHEVCVLHVLDAAELDLGFENLVELRELETGARLVIQAGEIREAYRQEVLKYLDELRRGCADCLAQYRLLDTRTPVEEALHALWH